MIFAGVIVNLGVQYTACYLPFYAYDGAADIDMNLVERSIGLKIKLYFLINEPVIHEFQYVTSYDDRHIILDRLTRRVFPQSFTNVNAVGRIVGPQG